MKNLIRTVVSSSKSTLKPYGSKFQQKYPKFYRLVSVLKNGTSRFTKESILFLKLKLRLSSEPNYLNSMTWKEVEVFRQLPRDWKKVAPVMIISAFPFLNYIVLPIAYVYPHKLLCGQFWTLEQHLKFGELDYYNKIKLYNPLLDHLALHAENKLVNDTKAKYVLLDLIDKIKEGHGPSDLEVLELKPILSKPEFSLKNLTFDHLDMLVKVENCRRVFNLIHNQNLSYYAYWLKESDRKLLDIDLNKLPIDHIYYMCFERGINARSHSIGDLANNLRYWLNYSDKLFSLRQTNSAQRSEEYFTLYLHSKILLKQSINQKSIK